MHSELAEVAPKRFRFRFSLLALLIFITLICVALAWLVQPRRVVATALFEVSATSPRSEGGAATAGDREFDILKQTQLALLKSDFVLTAALRPPGIASLPIFQGNADPVAWLQNNLQVEFPQNAEILAIKLRGPEAQAADLVRIVDSVAKAYRNEVVSEMRQRQLADRDLVARYLENLNQEIKRKMEEFLDIARESGKLDDGVSQQLGTKRLERIDDEIMRLESDLASNPSGEAAKRTSIEQRINHLQKRQADLETMLTSRAEKSTDSETRQRELEQLQRIGDEMSMKVKRMDFEANSPDRIRQLQPAVISPQ